MLQLGAGKSSVGAAELVLGSPGWFYPSFSLENQRRWEHLPAPSASHPALKMPFFVLRFAALRSCPGAQPSAQPSVGCSESNPTGENLLCSPHSHLQRPPPSIPAPSLCSFPEFSPQICRIQPPALLRVRAELGGFWNHPGPAGILRNAAGAGKGAPQSLRQPRSGWQSGIWGIWVLFPSPSRDKLPAGLQHPRCWGRSIVIHPWIGRL